MSINKPNIGSFWWP